MKEVPFDKFTVRTKINNEKKKARIKAVNLKSKLGIAVWGVLHFTSLNWPWACLMSCCVIFYYIRCEIIILTRRFIWFSQVTFPLFYLQYIKIINVCEFWTIVSPISKKQEALLFVYCYFNFGTQYSYLNKFALWSIHMWLNCYLNHILPDMWHVRGLLVLLLLPVGQSHFTHKTTLLLCVQQTDFKTCRYLPYRTKQVASIWRSSLFSRRSGECDDDFYDDLFLAGK